MSKGLSYFVVVSFLLFAISSTAFGWAGNTHAALCQRTFDDPVLQPFLSGINQSEIENWVGEPPSGLSSWGSIYDRSYINDNWGSTDETTRLKYLQHITTDCAVPIGHSPANLSPGGFTDAGKEAYLEAQVATWSSWPSVSGTTSFTNSKTGHSYNFTGTITDIANSAGTFYNAVRDNMTWSKNNLAGFPYFYDYNDYRAAGWNGTTIGLMLQRAVFVDYFLAKEHVEMTPYHFPVGYAGGNITLNQDDSYDPDCISWNSNGTYSQIYGIHPQGIQYVLWDVNGDVPSGGDWDYGAYDTSIDIPVNDLINIWGLQPNQWNVFYAAAVDNEGKWWSVEDYMYLSTGGMMAVPEPATMVLLGLGGVALLRCRRK